MNYCPNCGNQINENDIICKNCGKTIKTENQGEISFVACIFLLVGLCGMIFGIYTIISERTHHHYTFTPPLTEYEIGIFAILIIAILVAAISASCIRRR